MGLTVSDAIRLLMLRIADECRLPFGVRSPEQVNAFFKLLDQYFGCKSTLITTNIGYEEWYQLFQRKSLVDAMLDRLQHHCVTTNIDGPSLRAPDESADS